MSTETIETPQSFEEILNLDPQNEHLFNIFRNPINEYNFGLKKNNEEANIINACKLMLKLLVKTLDDNQTIKINLIRGIIPIDSFISIVIDKTFERENIEKYVNFFIDHGNQENSEEDKINYIYNYIYTQKYIEHFQEYISKLYSQYYQQIKESNLKQAS